MVTVSPGNPAVAIIIIVLYATIITIFALFKKEFYDNFKTNIKKTAIIIFSILVLSVILTVINLFYFPTALLITFFYCIIFTIILSLTVKLKRKEALILFILVWIVIIKLVFAILR